MITQRTVHPPKDQLLAFGQGKLAAEESSRVEQHLEVCRECCETLLDLKHDTFTGLVRDARSLVVEPMPADGSATEADAPPGGAVAERAVAQAATLAVQSGESLGSYELPIELAEHPRYRIVEVIGRGGMGCVYRAEHRLMNRPVAVKVINPQLLQNAQAVERFRREVQAAAKLSHPNIVTAYDAEQAGNAHFLVMEFVEGTDLASIVNHRGPMRVSEACKCIRQAAEGLQHAHERGMVHRDIKPHNLMLAAGGKVRILDFGLAGFASEIVADAGSVRAENQPDAGSVRAKDQPDAGSVGHAHLTALGSVMGTPDYMAPEQAVDAHQADIRADIYSLGCTLHFLLTGKPPFEADRVAAKLVAHVEQLPPMLTTRRTDVPQELSAVVARMMAKDPAERFETPAEVATALAPFAEPAAPPTRRRVRFRVAAALLGAAMFLGGVIFVTTDKGRLEIQSAVEDVQVTVKRGGEQVTTIDLKTGSQVHWLPSGKYELALVGQANDVKLDSTGFQMTRFGKVIVTATWSTEGLGAIRSFDAKDEPITRDGVEVGDGGWKITAADTRTVRLFEAPLPELQPGPFFYHAKLKTKNVKGRAYLEMWVRFPGEGEFFSKGFHNAVSGTNGWAEYQIPFVLGQGQQPDLAKLNLTIEGTGTVWIKDIQLRRRQAVLEEPASAQVKVGNLVANPGFEESVDPNGRQAADWMAERTTLATEPDADCYRDTESKYRGTASGAVVKQQSNSDAPEAGFVQRIAGLPKGQNLRLSGYLKTKDLEGAAYLVLRIVDFQRGPVPVAWCVTPSVKGTTDWQRYEAYIRTDAADGMLGLVMRGRGTVWFDEVSLEIAPQEAPMTARLVTGRPLVDSLVHPLQIREIAGSPHPDVALDCRGVLRASVFQHSTRPRSKP